MTGPEAEDLSGLTPLTWIEQQAGVVPWMRDGGGVLRLVIVTSRRTGRWVFPKGAIDPGMTAPQAAQQEALEEAGLIGTAHPEPIGSYQSLKIRPPALWTIQVDLFPMHIDEILDVWLEADQRERRFASVDEATALVTGLDVPALARALPEGRGGR